MLTKTRSLFLALAISNLTPFCAYAITPHTKATAKASGKIVGGAALVLSSFINYLTYGIKQKDLLMRSIATADTTAPTVDPGTTQTTLQRIWFNIRNIDQLRLIGNELPAGICMSIVGAKLAQHGWNDLKELNQA